MTKANEIYRYDVFISYSYRDRDWVQDWLLPRLEAAGLCVCIDFRDFEPGLPSLVNMENAVRHSRKTLIVLTPTWVESEWAAFESLLIQTDDPASRQGRMIPLLLKPCDLPKRIAMLTYLDFTEEPEAESLLHRLVATIREDAPSISLPSLQKDEEKQERVPSEEFLQLPDVEVVTRGGKLIRGWLVRKLGSGTVIGIAGLIIATLACVGTYLTVPQVQKFITLCLATPTPRSTMVNTYPFYVYRDNDSPDNHFSFWDGIMGDGESIGWGSQIDYGYFNDCHSGSTCMRIAYTPVTPDAYWVGISWQHPQGNWGTINEGFDLRKAARLTFWARGEKGGEAVTFGMGGIGRKRDSCDPNSPYPDSVCPTVWTSPLRLSAAWQQYSIDLGGKDLGHVITGFLISIGGENAQTIYLDEIRYESEPQATATATATLSPIPTPTSTVTLTPTPTPTCAVKAVTDAETLFALIDAEAQAVLGENMELIRNIFAPYAIIRNEATDQEWSSPEVYYIEKFRNEVHCKAKHYDYRILKLTDEEALVSTGSRGKWGWQAEGCTRTYENPPGADQWHFRKNAFGCWQIVRFTYNAHTQ